jgi:nickel superoxide dismutase
MMYKTKQWSMVILAGLAICYSKLDLSAHCQLPCGIYHDAMVFDQIDQYTETMYKGIAVLNQLKIQNVHDQNELVRWIMEKEKESNDISNVFTFYFLQQKIKPDEPDTVKMLKSAHKLLFLIVAIKQNTDLKFVKEFAAEWEKFKRMFHIEGYECKVEMMKIKALENPPQNETSKSTQNHNHNHNDGQDHDHNDHDHDDHSH